MPDDFKVGSRLLTFNHNLYLKQLLQFFCLHQSLLLPYRNRYLLPHNLGEENSNRFDAELITKMIYATWNTIIGRISRWRQFDLKYNHSRARRVYSRLCTAQHNGPMRGVNWIVWTCLKMRVCACQNFRWFCICISHHLIESLHI